MAVSQKHGQSVLISLQKSSTGITGLDEITGGGLPIGRSTLICGGPGCGKTLLALEFLIHGAEQYNEPGVFMACNQGDLAQVGISSLADTWISLRALEYNEQIVI